VTADLATITGIKVPTALLIGGQWTGGRAGVLPVVDAATEDAVAEVAGASTEDALDAVTAAQDALPAWLKTPPRQRGECLRRAWELMTGRAEPLARLMVVENGYLYTSDLRRALQVSEALEAGMVGINRGVVSDPAAPFGGVKQSRLGREGARDGLLEFTETKYIAVDW
jgi:acyl-CoA reductase-like NAD-dependent aldehyde dehydrogenase